MFDKRNLAYLLTALEAIEKTFLYTQDVANSDDFLEINSQMNFNACQTLLLVIGEETKKLDPQLRNNFSNIPWHLIVSFRNRIAHDYRSIDPYISFDIIRNYLPELKEVLIAMLDQISFERELLERVLGTPYYANIKYLL